MREAAAERKQRRAAEQEQRQAEDRAQAERIGTEFGLGAVTSVARFTRSRPFLAACGLALAGGGLITALVFGLANGPYPLAAKVAVPAVSVAAALLGWRLMRVSLRPRAVDRLIRYSGGLVQLAQDEPEPRIMRWAEVDSVTLFFDNDSDSRFTGLIGCRLRDSRGAEIGVGLGYGQPVVRTLVAEVDRMLAGKFVSALIQAYDAGERVSAGRWRIDRAGLALVHDSGREALTPWRDIRAVEHHGDGEPAQAVAIDLGGRRRRSIDLSAVPDGMFVPRLIEYAAGQNGIPVRRPGAGLAADGTDEPRPVRHKKVLLAVLLRGQG